MSNYIKIKKGLNIKLSGEAEKLVSNLPVPATYSLKPPDFINLVPKLLVAQGDEVQAGTPLFYDKDNEAIKFCSPVSGEVIEIVRGEFNILRIASGQTLSNCVIPGKSNCRVYRDIV